jgi:hypothetical protein
VLQVVFLSATENLTPGNGLINPILVIGGIDCRGKVSTN